MPPPFGSGLRVLRMGKDGAETITSPCHLYVPALAGLQFNPVLRAQTQRLLAKGKPGKVRVGAAMRKLLCRCVGVLRSGQPWNSTGRPTPITPDR